MFDFTKRRTVCMAGMKAYQVSLYGDDPKVLDGSWGTLFDEGEGPTEGKSFEGAIGNGAGSEDKIREDLENGDEDDGMIEEDESGAKEMGGETKGGDKKGSKRMKGQKTLDGHFKKLKTG